MMLGVTIKNLGKVAVLRCEGRIVAGDGATALRNAAMSQGSKQILILDLARVEAIDGSGLGLLVFLQGWTRTLGIALKLMNPMKQVQELLELTNLDSVFDICSSEDVASLLGHTALSASTTEVAHRFQEQCK
jgi:anti-anti-sigma factor